MHEPNGHRAFAPRLRVPMWERLPDVVRRYFELDPHRDGELFLGLFSDDATGLDERQTHHGTDEIRAWREGPATKYS